MLPLQLPPLLLLGCCCAFLAPCCPCSCLLLLLTPRFRRPAAAAALPFPTYARSAVTWLMVILGVLCALGILGINLAPLLALGGCSSLVIGFASQQVRLPV